MADEKPAEDEKAEESKSKGGKGAMMPLILTVVLMPVMAFVMTNFVLLPKIQKAIVASAKVTSGDHIEGEDEVVDEVGGSHPEPDPGHDPDIKTTPKGAPARYPLDKLIANVKGTMGTRFLMTSLTLVGKGSKFVPLCTENDPQLRDVALNVLSGKTIQDMEKLGFRNMLRLELISTFNTALGTPAVREIYITEFAIQ